MNNFEKSRLAESVITLAITFILKQSLKLPKPSFTVLCKITEFPVDWLGIITEKLSITMKTSK